MTEFDVLNRLRTLCNERNWSLYRLAKESGITYSTLNSMFNKSNIPTVATLLKLCDGLGITMSQFFCDDEISDLSKSQKECLELWNKLDKQSKKLAISYMSGMLKEL